MLLKTRDKNDAKRNTVCLGHDDIGRIFLIDLDLIDDKAFDPVKADVADFDFAF